MPLSPFLALAYANRLANARLSKACVALAPGEFAASRTGFFPSIKATLNHILVVDWFYVDALEGGDLGARAWQDEEPFAEPEALGTEQADVDERLIAVCKTLRNPFDEVRMTRPRGIVTDTAQNVLLHLFSHQTHHRGQAHAMLSGTLAPPPQLDEFIMGGDAAARADDMKEIGWTEDIFRR